MYMTRNENSLMLLKRHCAEWLNLFADEKKERHNLGLLHTSESNRLLIEKKDRLKVAETLNRHSLELAEFMDNKNAARTSLKEKQQNESLLLKENFKYPALS